MAPESSGGPQAVRTRDDLARELSVLRQKRGLTIRQLAKAVEVPTATVGDYFSGRHLPGPSQLDTLRRLLAACGVTRPEDHEEWVAAVMRARATSDGRTARAVAPYRGLEAFQEEDAELFFGREAALAELLEMVSAAKADGAGIVVLVGPSGSGKSSLLRAGLVPAVRAGALDPGLPASVESTEGGNGSSDVPDGGPSTNGKGSRPQGAPGWDCAVMTPGHAPLRALAACVGGPAPAGRLVVVDQFEELFASEVEPDERAQFLVELGRADAAQAVFVLGMRADFYEAAAREPVLLPALRNHQVLLGPMTQAEVRRAVAEPAARVGVAVEDGLVDLLLADLAPGSPSGFAHGAGALPLMSHALFAAWEQAQHNRLTIADYRGVGGLRGAVSQSAEELFGRLSPAQQDLARLVFLRLVSVREGAPPTKRKVPSQELAELGAADLVQRFADARLLTLDAGTVEVSHEVLLSAWPRLADWVDADHAGLRVHRQLTDAANQWTAGGRDVSLLYRGPRLQAAVDWAGEPGEGGGPGKGLNQTEREFLEASVAQARAEHLAARRRARRMQQMLVAVAVLAVVASGLAVVAFRARASANATRDQALSREVASEAQQLAPTDPSLAMQLALAAYRISPTVQARSTLIGTSSGPMPTRLAGPAGAQALSVDRSGLVLARAESSVDRVVLYRLVNGIPRPASSFAAGPPSQQDYAVAISPDGRLLAVGGTGAKVELWRVGDLHHPSLWTTLKGFTSTVYDLVFSPDGKWLAGAAAGAGASGTVTQWDVGAGDLAPVVTRFSGASAMKAVAYSPDGRWVGAVGGGGTVALWRPGTTGPAEVASAGTSTEETLAFLPGRDQLVTGGDDHYVRTYSFNGAGRLAPARKPFAAGDSYVSLVAYSPDGANLAVGSAGGSVRVWPADATGGPPVEVLPDSDPVTSMVFLPGGRLAVADSSGWARLWDLPSPSTYVAPGSIEFVQYFDGGRYVAATSGGPAGNVTIWATPAGRPAQLVASVSMPAGRGPVAGVSAVSPSGRLVAVANAEQQVQLVDVSDLRHPRFVGPLFKVATSTIEEMGFLSDTVLATSDDNAEVRLWDVSDQRRPRALSTIGQLGGKVLGFSFSNGGSMLAAAVSSGDVSLWRTTDPARPQHLATVHGFSAYTFDTAFAPDAKVLAAGASDGTVRLWDISDPAHPRALGAPLDGPQSYVITVGISPDGRYLAAMAPAGTWLWDISDPAHPSLFATVSQDANEGWSLDFSPDGHTVAGGGGDQVLHLWDYRPDRVAADICARAGAPITPQEWAQYVPGAPYRPPCP